jgi:ProP effector
LALTRDIADALGSDEGIKAALGLYCSNYEYRRKLRVDAPRIDLNGDVAGTVSAEEAQFAEKLVAKAARRRQLAIEAEAKSKEPPPPKRISLSDLRVAAAAKKAAMSGAAK